jgi:hypothetical protein
MPTISIEQFYQYVAPHVSGAPKQVVLNEIMGAVIEFCDETDVVEVDLDPVAVSAGDTEMELDLPSGTRVSRVKSLTPLDGAPRFNEGSYALNGRLIKFIAPLPMELTIVATVALKPTRSSAKCDDTIFEDWLDAIVAGTLYKLKLMSGREWADTQAAMVNEALFRRAKVNAKHMARTKRVYGIGRVKLECSANNYFAE